MKSTTENLRSICLRLITTSLVIFVLMELMMAFIALFIFIPDNRKASLTAKEHYLRIGVESSKKSDLQKFLVKKDSPKVDIQIVSLGDGIEAIHGMAQNVYDIVCTDFLAAEYLVDNGLATPLAYLKDEDREIVWERMLLLGLRDAPEFISQTRGRSIMLTGGQGKLARKVGEHFLTAKLEDMDSWFSTVSISFTTEYSMKTLQGKNVDLVLILESDFKKMYTEEQRSAFKVIWYSEPLPHKIVLRKNDLPEPLVNYSLELFKGENAFGEYWKPFSESLLTMKDWQFRISGKNFEYDKNRVYGYGSK